MSYVIPDLSQDTVLDMVELGVVPGSARGMKQDLKPLENGKVYVTVNGNDVNTGRPALNLFVTTVSGEDLWPPAIGGLWRGALVTLHCAVEIVQRAGTDFVRPAVDGSIRYLDADMNDLSSSTGAAWVCFRPILRCVVLDFSTDRDEWTDKVTWSISFRETRRA
jgi:hypothetical protein